MRLLLNEDADAGWYGTALHMASRCDHEVVVKLLLDRGVDVETEDGDGSFGDDSDDDSQDSIYGYRDNPTVELETRGFDHETHVPCKSGQFLLTPLLTSPRLDHANMDDPFTVDAPNTSVMGKRNAQDLAQVCHWREDYR